MAAFSLFLFQQADKIEKFMNDDQNKDAVDEVMRTTGLDRDRINSDAKNGQGPVVELESKTGGIRYSESQNVDQNKIRICGLGLVAQFNAQKNNNDEEEYYQGIANLMYVLHEYGHFGDKVTNGGYNSGQTFRNSRDHEFSTDKSGRQKKEAISGHRGTDIDQQVIFGKTYTEGSNSTNFNGGDIYWEEDYKTLTPNFRRAVNASQRFGPFKKKSK